jgi:DNA invertase Pin-like site-specific DNA recombinase
MMERCRTVAYLRVASAEHDLEKTKAEILDWATEKGLGEVEWIEEIVSGLVSWKKRKIVQILEELQSGDNLIVRDLSRLGRSEQQCVEILSNASEKGIHVYVVDQPWLLDGLIPSHLLSPGFSMTPELQNKLAMRRTKKVLYTLNLMKSDEGFGS